MDLSKLRQEYTKKLEFFQDPSFIFESDSHTYHYSGIKYDSVTTFLKRFKVPFDNDYWSKRKAKDF